MSQNKFHQDIIHFYNTTENSYIDGWDLNNSLAMHYGYWDQKVKSFPESLKRMNEVLMEAAEIKDGDRVLDAGCGIGGTSLFIAKEKKCQVIGISLSEKQIKKANTLAKQLNLETKASFEVQDYCETTFANNTFDVVLACESVCHAIDKKLFLNEAHRILKPGGRLVIVDGFVSKFENNQHPIIKKWLMGWQVNYLESPERLKLFLKGLDFIDIGYKDISEFTKQSSKRLYWIYYLATIYLFFKSITFSNKATELQKLNIKASRFQYLGLKQKLWAHGILSARKTH
jgi:cyclopropane fatty-acyl-phospholipid synthase-like methyltransferase